MLKTVDVFIGLALVMLLVSMVVTVITQIVTNILNSRGRYLRNGVNDVLKQLMPGIEGKISKEVANAALRNPLVSSTWGRLGNVVHREELSKLLLELGAGDSSVKLSDAARDALHKALVDGGICKAGNAEAIQAQIREKLGNVRSLALQLELSHPELTNAARARVAMIQQANSQFLAKINLWFDQTMDRTSEQFTSHTRYVTFFAGLAVAMALQLDTAALVSRLSIDDDLRKSLLTIAEKQTAPGAQQAASAVGGQQTAPTAASPSSAPNTANQPPASNTANPQSTPVTPVSLNDLDRQNLKDLMVNNVIGIPQSLSDWEHRWTRDNFWMKLLGIVLSAFLLSLGAPFWYGALQNLLRLRSVLATKDDQQRQERQVTGPTAAAAAAAAAATTQDGVVLTDERGDLTAIA